MIQSNYPKIQQRKGNATMHDSRSSTKSALAHSETQKLLFSKKVFTDYDFILVVACVFDVNIRKVR